MRRKPGMSSTMDFDAVSDAILSNRHLGRIAAV
jgi:hypothetical protein